MFGLNLVIVVLLLFSGIVDSTIRIHGTKNNKEIEFENGWPENLSFSAGDILRLTCGNTDTIEKVNYKWPTLGWKQEKHEMFISMPPFDVKYSTLNMILDRFDDGSNLTCTLYESADLKSVKEQKSFHLYYEPSANSNYCEFYNKQGKIIKCIDSLNRTGDKYNIGPKLNISHTSDNTMDICVLKSSGIVKYNSFEKEANSTRHVLYMNKPPCEADVTTTSKTTKNEAPTPTTRENEDPYPRTREAGANTMTINKNTTLKESNEVNGDRYKPTNSHGKESQNKSRTEHSEHTKVGDNNDKIIWIGVAAGIITVVIITIIIIYIKKKSRNLPQESLYATANDLIYADLELPETGNAEVPNRSTVPYATVVGVVVTKKHRQITQHLE